ncbi:hypothetical protein C8R42DRAFT_718219 [Lentinula raphanica]|nr:hypothetical protein C8R42DRAFT_718219 [Lentinula raphanica]
MSTYIPSEEGPSISRPIKTALGSAPTSRQSGRPVTRKQIRPPNLVRSRSATSSQQQRSPRRQNTSVSFLHTTRTTPSTTRRNRRFTYLPTPRIPPPTRSSIFSLGSRPSKPIFKKRARSNLSGSADGGRANFVAQTVKVKSGNQQVVKRVTQPQPPGGIWMDRHGRLRNPDSDSDSSMISSLVVSTSDDEPALVSVQSNLSARKVTQSLSITSSGTSDEDDVDESDESVPNSDSEEDQLVSDNEVAEDDAESDVAVVGDSIGTESLSVPSDALVQALKPLLFHFPLRNLPFLRRNLRIAFKGSFMQTTTLIQAPHEVILRVLLRATSDQSRWSFSLNTWSCPLCNLLGELESREMLETHLHWHHSEVNVFWLKENDSEWRLILSLPEPSASHIEHAIAPNFRYAFIKPKEIPDSEYQDVLANQTLTSLTLEDEDGQTNISIPLSPTTAVPDTPASGDVSISIAEPSISSPSGDVRHRRGRTSLAVEPRLLLRYPTPPPADNPFGPAAQYPYLPATSDDGKITVKYSCRAGGPYLFDLLDLLPLDEFGVLSWLVLDREAEIFEDEEIGDELKVMHALWGRWIMLNRRWFIQDFLVGTIDFVDKYWRMIHMAAGWSALRYWLTMLMVNKYLQANEVAHVLTHYEEKTGMKNWYNPRGW